MMNNSEEIEYFLSNICTKEWNEEQDAGGSFHEAVQILSKRYPEYAHFIEAYDLRWDEMLGDVKADVLKIVEELKSKNVPLYALTNWSSEKFPIAKKRYDFLKLFDGIMVSGDVKVKKPDIHIFQLFIKQFHVIAKCTLFIDDSSDNIAVAKKSGYADCSFQECPGFAKSNPSIHFLVM